jgi:hypothetical protein
MTLLDRTQASRGTIWEGQFDRTSDIHGPEQNNQPTPPSKLMATSHSTLQHSQSVQH